MSDSLFRFLVVALLVGIAASHYCTHLKVDKIMATLAEAESKLDEIIVFLEEDATNDAELAADMDTLLQLAQDDENIPDSFVEKLGLAVDKARGGTERSRAMADKFPAAPEA